MNEYIYLGIVEQVEDGMAQITQRNKFCVGDVIEVMKPEGKNVAVRVTALYDDEHNAVESAPHPQQKLYVALEDVETGSAVDVYPYDLLRVHNK